MNQNRTDIDRDVLKPRAGLWVDDPHTRLSDDEFKRVIDGFGDVEIKDPEELELGVKNTFREFVTNIEPERFVEVNGRLKEASKPSTRIELEVAALRDAFESLERAFGALSPTTETWLDQQLKEYGARDSNDRPLKLPVLKQNIYPAMDVFLGVARGAKGVTKSGPNNAALKIMIERMATIWEDLHGKLPPTDKGRGLTFDPFRELCQLVEGMARTRLKERGVDIGSRQLSGLVDDVVKGMRSAA